MNAFPRFLTIIGALMIVTAMVAHIVCVATTNLARMDFQSYVEKLNHTLHEMISNGLEDDSAKLQQEAAMNPAMMGEGANLHYGIWSLCMRMSMLSSSPMEACFSWGSSFAEEGSMEKPDWIDGVRGCYIAGLVLAGLAVILSNTNAHTPSQGDRRRILPFFICTTSVLAGVVILIGNLIVAFSFNKDFTLPGLGQLSPKVLEAFHKVMESSFSLSWGFALDLTSAVVFILAGFFHLLAGRAAQREDKIRRQKEIMETPLPNYDVAPL